MSPGHRNDGEQTKQPQQAAWGKDTHAWVGADPKPHGRDATGTAGLWPRSLQTSPQPRVSYQGSMSLGSAWLCLSQSQAVLMGRRG